MNRVSPVSTTRIIVAQTLLLALIVLLTMHTPMANAAPTLDARVDRAQLTEGDSLSLTLTLSDTGNYPDPDFSTLRRDFSIANVSQSSNHILSNGRLQSLTEWQITLVPKRSGLLTIPAFVIDDYRSKPIAIRVEPAGATANSDDRDAEGGEPVFMEVEIDHESVYVQQQVLLKVRVFHSIALDDMNLTEPEFDNATVRKVAQENFRREIGGATYQVHQLTYAIFPQQSGELTIPELVFSGAELQQRRRLFDFPGQGRPVRKLSKQIAIHVKPVPSQFTGKVWLPARNLTIQETWGGNPDDIKAGNSITRSIALQADGLMAAQLPALETPTLQQARLYPDQPALDDQADASGMHGLRKESAALIPARDGPLQLPEQRVVWWDLDTDSEKVATIPAQTLSIKPGSSSLQPTPPPANDATHTTHDITAPSTNISTSLSSQSSWAQTWMWAAAAAILGCGWLVTMILYWRLRRRSSIAALPATPANQDTKAPELFAHIMQACAQNDARSAYAALGRWLRAAHPDTPTIERWLHSQEQISETAALVDAVENLQRHIYREENNTWRGAELANALNAWRKRQDRKRVQSHALPALYPT